MSLKRRAVRGLFWTFLERFSIQGVSFVVSVLLARLLAPEQFGLIGMIAIVIAISTTLRDSGLTSSLIRTPNPTQEDFSTVFFMNIALSVLIYGVLFLTAPLVADFFDRVELISIVRVLGLKVVIGAFSSVQHTRLTKSMNFKRQLMIQLPAVIISGLAGLAFAFYGFGVWSLVYMNLIQVTLSSLLFWMFTDWYPTPEFSGACMKRHFHFGYKLTLSSLLNTLHAHLNNILIGKFFSAAQLGFYSRAQTLKQLPVDNISSALNKVAYPLFSELQDKDEKLRSVYKRLMQQVLFWIAPLLMGAGVLAEPLFRFLLTEKWLPAVPYFQILCFVGIMYPLHAYNLQILNVKGRSDLFLKLEIIKKFIGIAFVAIGIQFGIYGLLWGEVAFNVVGFFINTRYSGRLINYKVTAQLKDIGPILAMAGAAGIFVAGMDQLLISQHDFVRLALGGVLGVGTYLLLAYWAKSPALTEFRSIVRNR